MAVHFDYSKESFWKQLLPKSFQGTKAQSIQVNNNFPGVSASKLLLVLILTSCDSSCYVYIADWLLNYLAILVKSSFLCHPAQVWAFLIPVLYLQKRGIEKKLSS